MFTSGKGAERSSLRLDFAHPLVDDGNRWKQVEIAKLSSSLFSFDRKVENWSIESTPSSKICKRPNLCNAILEDRKHKLIYCVNNYKGLLHHCTEWTEEHEFLNVYFLKSKAWWLWQDDKMLMTKDTPQRWKENMRRLLKWICHSGKGGVHMHFVLFWFRNLHNHPVFIPSSSSSTASFQ